MPQRLTQIRVPRVSFVDRAAVRDPARPSEPRRFVLLKAEGSTSDQGDEVTDIDRSELDPGVLALIEKAEEERDAALAKASANSADSTGPGKAPADNADAPDQEDKDRKSSKMSKAEQDELPQAVRDYIAKAEEDRAADQERIRKAEERAETATTLAKAEESLRITQEFITKAESGTLRGIPGAPAEIGPLLKRLSDADGEAYAELEKSVLAPAAEQLLQSELFKEQGRAGEGPPPESATAKFKSEVATLRKAESTLTESQAMERVRQEQPELMKAMHRELRGEEAVAATHAARGA